VAVDQLAHMRVFESVARLCSFTAAAKELDVALPTISKRIARLEGHLNATLLTRTTRKVELTPVGREFFNRCTRIIKGVDEALQIVVDSNVPPEGHLRVHTSVELGKRYVIPLIAQYRQPHPAVTFELTLDSRLPEALMGEVDVLIAIGVFEKRDWAIRNIGATYSILCASKDYLDRNGCPMIPEDLLTHECIRPLDEPTVTSDTWTFGGPFGSVNVYLPPSSFQLNSSDAIVDAACSGLGIASVPAFVASQYLNDGRLVRVLPKYYLESMGIHVMFSEASVSNPSLRSWIGFLSAHLPKSLAQGMHDGAF
jgi:DNA-binding transcriptional LysR family regulator